MSALEIFAIITALVGIFGAVVPAVPGPPLCWIALLMTYFAQTSNPLEAKSLYIWLAVTIVVTVLDYVIPALTTRATGGHKAASIGATIGVMAGIFLTPIGMMAGGLLGAFLGEFLFENGGVWSSFKASLGAFAGFVTMMLVKVLVCGMMLYAVLVHIF